MKTINLNYATPPYQHAALYIVLSGSLLCLLVLLGFYLHLVAQVSAMDTAIEQIKSPQSESGARLVTHKVNSDEMIEVQHAMRELTIPWVPLFETLEGLNNSQVRLLSVEPEIKQHQLKLTAEARDIKQMLDYVSTLAHQTNQGQSGKDRSKVATLENVLLVSQTQTTGTSGQPVLSFVVEAKWVF